ncbi:MAG: His/Gly/Thr/Pro-type tRNA ligase C-terminal domain-containing protein, partial [Pseudobdellovibrionaceae bacterium]
RLSELVPAEKYQKTEALLAIIPADEKGEAASLPLAHKLRQKGLRSEILLSGKMGKRFQKADKMGATHALVLGESEVKAQLIAVKDLKSGVQENLSVEELLTKLE